MGYTKIVDTIVIVASLEYVRCHPLFDLYCDNYSVATSNEVYEEFAAGEGADLSPLTERMVIHDLSDTEVYNAALSHMVNRYQKLGVGELSSFLAAYLLYHTQGIDYYYVTDDGLMRDTIPRFKNDRLLTEILGGEPIDSVNLTGTVGLVMHLYDKGLITKEVRKQIASDLRNSPFRASEELLNLLENC